MGALTQIIGVPCIIAGAYLFRDKSGSRKGSRVINLFTLIGASIGFLFLGPPIWRETQQGPYGALSMVPDTIDLVAFQIIGAILCAFIARYLSRVAERAIIFGAPPWMVLLLIEYLEKEWGVDLLDLMERIPNFPNIPLGWLEGLLLLIVTTMTLAMKKIMRKYVPLAIAGILSGVLLYYGLVMLVTGNRDGGEGMEIFGVVSVAICSVSYQLYYDRGKESTAILKKIYEEDSELAVLAQNAEDAKKTKVMSFGDTLVVTCPACSVESEHKVITRKSSGAGFEVLVNCRWMNEWDEVCNNYHTLLEVKTGTYYHSE